jgi:hypothetical protein
MRLEKSEDLDNVYKLFGVCAHHCSNIEYSVAFLLHPVKWEKHRVNLKRKNQETQNTRDIKKWIAKMKKFDEALDNANQDIGNLDKMTLGNLIGQVKVKYSLSDEQVKYLREILEKRNYLIHKMWGDYGRRLKDSLIIKEMLRELQTYEPYFRFASDWLRKQAYLLNGVSEEMINE